jgi:hypothetical protein
VAAQITHQRRAPGCFRADHSYKFAPLVTAGVIQIQIGCVSKEMQNEFLRKPRLPQCR